MASWNGAPGITLKASVIRRAHEITLGEVDTRKLPGHVAVVVAGAVWVVPDRCATVTHGNSVKYY